MPAQDVRLIATITPEALPAQFRQLAGEYALHPPRPGHLRAALPAGSRFEWLDLESAADADRAATVLWFGSRFSADCRAGQWGFDRALTGEELLAGDVLLPAREPGHQAAALKLMAPEACGIG